MRIAAPVTPEQTDLDTRRAVAELQRAARTNAGLSDTMARVVFGLFGDSSNTARPVVLVKRSTSRSVATGTDTLETFDQVLVDTDHLFSAALPDRIVVQTPGVYIAVAANNFTANGTGYRVLDILALGTHPVNNVIGGNTDAGISGGPNLMQAVSAPFPFDAGSELFLNMYQTSGGSLSTLTTYGGTWLAVIYLQPLP